MRAPACNSPSTKKRGALTAASLLAIQVSEPRTGAPLCHKAQAGCLHRRFERATAARAKTTRDENAIAEQMLRKRDSTIFEHARCDVRADHVRAGERTGNVASAPDLGGFEMIRCEVRLRHAHCYRVRVNRVGDRSPLSCR